VHKKIAIPSQRFIMKREARKTLNLNDIFMKSLYHEGNEEDIWAASTKES